MSLDFRLVAEDAYLELEGLGSYILLGRGHREGLVSEEILLAATVKVKKVPSDNVRSENPWKGALAFVREFGDARLLHEEDEGYDDVEGRSAFSVNSRTGHFKKKGYGPV